MKTNNILGLALLILCSNALMAQRNKLPDVTRLQIEIDRGAYLKLVRDYVHQITEIVRNGETDPTDSSSLYKVYANRVKIIFLDNNNPDESIFEADSFTKSIRLRIDGILEEINWE